MSIFEEYGALNILCFFSAIYCVFMFQKVKDMDTGEEWKSSQKTEVSRKRPYEGATEIEPPKVQKYS